MIRYLTSVTHLNRQTKLNDEENVTIPYVGDVIVKKILTHLDNTFTDWNKVPAKIYPVKSVNVSLLRSIQPFVTKSTIERYIADPSTKLPVAFHMNGAYYIMNGTHRCEATARNQKIIKIHVIDPTNAKSLIDRYWKT
jgi:hypothetical protein